MFSIVINLIIDVIFGRRAGTFQSYTEVNTKTGTQFECSVRIPLVAGGTSAYIGFKTGNKKVIIKGRFLAFLGSSEIQYSASSQAVYSDGSPIIPTNLNTELGLLPGFAPTTTVVLNPTVVTVGNVYFKPFSVLAGGQNTNSRLGTDIIGKDTVLAANTYYLFKIENIDTNAAASPLFWYITYYKGKPDLP
jgi:hypothetical protein